jgi:hypothetical protein
MTARHKNTASYLTTLDGVLGYMGRTLRNSAPKSHTDDVQRAYVRGYEKAYSDVAHIRHVVWYDWFREDPEAADQHRIHWDELHTAENLGTHRIFPN